MATKRTSGSTGSVETSTSSRKYFTTPFNDLTEPGTYYSHENGWLYRVPEEMLALGHSPLINIVSDRENFVTKIADDPWVPVNKARQICSNMDFAVNF